MDRYRIIHRLKLGVPEIDTQHEEMANKLHAVSGALSDGDAAEVVLRLDELIACTEEHFRDEEHLFEMGGYSNLPEHRRQHAQLSAQLQDLKTRLASGKEPPNATLADSLWVWFGMHVLKADRLAADVINANHPDKVPQPR